MLVRTTVADLSRVMLAEIVLVRCSLGTPVEIVLV